MKYNYSEMSRKYRTFVPDMETKIETTNTGGKVLAYDGDELVGRLEFSFKGNVLSIDHTYAYKEGMGVGESACQCCQRLCHQQGTPHPAPLLIRRCLVPEASTVSGNSRISDLTFRIQLYFPRLWTSSTNRFISQYSEDGRSEVKKSISCFWFSNLPI